MIYESRTCRSPQSHFGSSGHTGSGVTKRKESESKTCHSPQKDDGKKRESFWLKPDSDHHLKRNYNRDYIKKYFNLLICLWIWVLAGVCTAKPMTRIEILKYNGKLEAYAYSSSALTSMERVIITHNGNWNTSQNFTPFCWDEWLYLDFIYLNLDINHIPLCKKASPILQASPADDEGGCGAAASLQQWQGQGAVHTGRHIPSKARWNPIFEFEKYGGNINFQICTNLPSSREPPKYIQYQKIAGSVVGLTAKGFTPKFVWIGITNLGQISISILNTI